MRATGPYPLDVGGVRVHEGDEMLAGVGQGLCKLATATELNVLLQPKLDLEGRLGLAQFGAVVRTPLQAFRARPLQQRVLDLPDAFTGFQTPRPVSPPTSRVPPAPVQGPARTLRHDMNRSTSTMACRSASLASARADS